MQERPSVKKLLAYEEEVIKGLLKWPKRIAQTQAVDRLIGTRKYDAKKNRTERTNREETWLVEKYHAATSRSGNGTH